MKSKKFFASLAALTMLLGGCGKPADSSSSQNTSSESNSSSNNSSTASTPPENATLRILTTGDKPNDFDAVLEEFYKRTKDSLNVTLNFEFVPSSEYKDKLNLKMTAGEEYDLVFDAPWMHLRTLSNDGAYVDLSPYLNNPKYPGLQKCFPEEIMKYNKYGGINCALPLFINYTAINIVMYRLDWAKEFGIGQDGQIESLEELESYLKAVKEKKEGVIPIALKNNRGFYHLFDDYRYEGLTKEDNVYQGSLGKDIFFLYKLNSDATKVEAIAVPGDSEDKWAPFGGTDRWKKPLEMARQWNQYTEKDSINQSDPGSLFQVGKAGAYIDTIDAFAKYRDLLKSYVPEAELGIFVHGENARKMEKGTLSASVIASNYLAIPSTSKKVERTISFLNWIFESSENHDLFEYGIEGEHWVADGDSKYKLPEGVTAKTNYNALGYNLTWNPLYYRVSESYTPYALKYVEFAGNIDNFYISPVTGFQFNSDPVKTEITQCGSILSEILVPLAHGIYDNPYNYMAQATKKMYDSGLQTALDEYVRQLNEFLANKK